MRYRFLTFTGIAFALGSLAATAAGLGTAGATSGSSSSNLDLLTPGQINFAADFTAAPNQFYQSGKPDGLDPQLCSAIAADMGLKPVWTNLTFDSLIPGLLAHRFDALCTAVFVTKEREAVLNMVPYVQWGDAMGVPKSEAAKFDCEPTGGNYNRCFEKLAGLTVATTSGGEEQPQLVAANKVLTAAGLKPMNILAFDGNTQAYQALENKTAAAVWLDDPQVHYFDVVQQHGAYVEAFSGFESDELALTTPKSNVALARAFQKALNKMHKNGTYQTILARWGVEPVSSFAINPPASS